jgi:hypothetical protein
MQLVNTQLQKQIEYLGGANSTNTFKEYLQAILEDTTKPYYQRADYVGLSLNELNSKIKSVSHHIQELQAFKKRLVTSLEKAKEVTAEVLVANGIDRIDGNIISSLTLTKPTTKTKETLTILDKNAVMGLGYIKYEPDIEAITQAMKTKEGLETLDKFVSMDTSTVTTPSKVKVNTKRSNTHTQTEVLPHETIAA